MESAVSQIPYGGPEAEYIFSKSASRWQAACCRADAVSLTTERLDLRQMIARAPSIPDKIPSNAQYIEGHSTWENSDASCPLKTRTEKTRKISLRKRHRTTCTISASNNFQTWGKKPNNGIALLVLGWAYILSAELAERQGLSLEYIYPSGIPSGLTVLDLDYASPHELAWWQAVVRQSVGWSIAGSQVAPWAVSVDIGVVIHGDVDVGQRPPAAREAAYYLARLCHAYDLGSQSSAALAAALSIPLHASTTPFKAATIELPKLSLQACISSPGKEDYPADYQFISYFMTLSLCPWALGPSLWSIFWEPDVPCNFAGAWLGPIANMLKSIIHGNDLELLAKVLSFNNTAPMWLGVALCGQRAIIKSILPSLTELRDYPYFRPDVDAAAWTGTAQSFMDAHQTGPYFGDEAVTRADVWRLRHDCYAEYMNDGFLHTPPYGWHPFGKMQAVDVELEVRRHLACSHVWNYTHWTWLSSGTIDVGFSTNGMHIYQPPEESCVGSDRFRSTKVQESEIGYDVSETATKAIFWWSSEQVEKGFGGTLVPRRLGTDEAVESAESISRMEPKIIYQWLENIDTTA